MVPYINETTKTFPIPKGQVVGLVEKVDKKHISEISSHSSKEQTLVEQTDFNKDVSYVPQSHREALSALLKRFEHIFAHSEVDLGHTDLVKMKLDTGDHPPIKQKPYRLPFSQRPILESHLNDLLGLTLLKSQIALGLVQWSWSLRRMKLFA